MNAEELNQWRQIVRRLVIDGNDGADVYEATAFAEAMEAKYGKPFNLIEPSDEGTHEFPLFNEQGMFGPNPLVGRWTNDGFMASCRDMTKDEQLRELFPSSASDWRRFRAWLAATNPVEFVWLERYCANWNRSAHGKSDP